MSDWQAAWLSVELAACSVAALMALGTPLAWWLARGRRGALKALVEATVALPLVLPPTVLGFYLLVAFAPQAALGRLWNAATGDGFAFSFGGLVAGSVLYSLPFVVQPLHAAFAQVPERALEAAATLGASARDRFFSIALPMTRRSALAAASLGFAHTIGEFGIVLMIGGNIPGETRVLSIAVYDHVETLEYARAHRISAALIAFSMLALVLTYSMHPVRRAQ